MSLFRRLSFAVLLLSIISTHLSAELREPTDRVLLKVSGQIQHTNQGNEAHFDRAMLEELQQRTTRTNTPWTEQADDYRGPLGSALLAAVGAEDAEWMTISALNGFSSEVPVRDFMDYKIILALKKNDRYLRVRNRGPLFVIYPFDEQPHLNTEMHYNRSVWQVNAIELR